MRLVGELREHHRDTPAAQLREALDEDGYVLVRQALPADSLERLRAVLADAAWDAGWTLDRGSPGVPPLAREGAACASPEPAYLAAYHEVYRRPELHALPHEPALVALMTGLIGGRCFAHPRLVARMVFPQHAEAVTPPHQDWFQVQGTEHTLTCWVALHDCPRDTGPLILAERSHLEGFRPVRPAPGASGAAVIGAEKLRWRGADIRRGDVLVFTALTVHAALPNRSARMRLSADIRFQAVEESVCRSSLEFHSRSDLSWDKIYQGWPEDGPPRRYWEALPLRMVDFDPSVLAARDDEAFRLGEAGDITAISALQRIAAHDPDPAKRRRAQGLLEGLSAGRSPEAEPS